MRTELKLRDMFLSKANIGSQERKQELFQFVATVLLENTKIVHKQENKNVQNRNANFQHMSKFFDKRNQMRPGLKGGFTENGESSPR